MDRKKFLWTSLLGALIPAGKFSFSGKSEQVVGPVVISTWDNRKANRAAWDILSKAGTALDAVEAGARVPEADPADHSVGYGGYPDRTGKVTLDACIMNEESRCGSVAFLQDIKHPVSVARKVLESSPHVMLVGEGARQFAMKQGFKKENLLTDHAREVWESWKKNPEFPVTSWDKYINHDTIGILALDEQGNLSGACTTSGIGMKMHGRVGDSPLIGAGLFVDKEIGAAAATGVGEEVIRVAGSHLVVELMRHGSSPVEACKQAVDRIVSNNGGQMEGQVGFLALNKNGEYGGYSIQPGYSYAIRDMKTEELVKSKSRF
ncbi:N(4)-(beta-N-acetylglucosaminyl)-L-asparaginase [Aliifodinibius sp. S!AR15-10]|uniref:N(4)-(beta-N-acetylglucosaminyl)-L-asparaginase n=1 Tax=Aliifodinibius sp. S!AR15-10 TaxID=2950437 RepID=UPI0028669830|nr:N(4)-(beta-N-acetylglucosaminyl)-L-asparaginase [Aliifodinibius sp. S!AR15-10]MDR8392103.1 N(4)-(beta-N-acetylglucosaminyl)-L-asparaginase [Aliifodinibius sp. S!AR15-10]